MKVCGLIVEYNPMHQGHIYHIHEAKRITNCDILVVIMTTYFSQRGLPSLISPYDKTKLAIQYGADLVIELPIVYGCQSADRFAKYAIQSLSTLKINTLCFGSEIDDIEQLKSLADQIFLNAVDPSKSWVQNLALDLQPNDILGIQYIRYCRQYGIEPICIARNPQYKSATQTRADFFAFQTNEFHSEYFLIEQRWESYYPFLRLALLMSDPKYLASLFLVQEGIENRLIKAARSSRNWSDFLHSSISKTYTKARIQRTCLFILLQITKAEMEENASFHQALVLGFNEKGRKYLHFLRSPSVYTRFKDLSPFLKTIELKSRTLYESVLPQPVKKGIYVENDQKF